MPDLIHNLQGRDIGFLRIVARLWGLELNAPDAHTALPLLLSGLLNPPLVLEVVESLPHAAQAALAALVQREGRITWSEFVRRFGALREMGPGQRDRRRPYETPTSPTEILWYRGLIGRAFLETSSGPQEFAYIPDDLVPLLPALQAETPIPPGRPASPLESAHPLPATDRILDHACTMLAALRLGREPAQFDGSPLAIPAGILIQLLAEAGLLDKKGIPLPEPARAFLEAPRAAALLSLVQGWQTSRKFDELRLVPGLKCEGEWQNDPLAARKAILVHLSQVPPATWWNLNAFIGAIHERQPDFQRSAGEYDAWFIRSEASGEYLRGFARWEDVEGALIRFVLSGPLFWLGIIDLAAPAPDAAPTAFRLSTWATDLLSGKAPSGLRKEDGTIQLRSNGQLRLPAQTPRSVRYQIARFCAWEPAGEGLEYRYRITPSSLETARRQGLRPGQLIALLRRHASAPLMPSLVQALEHWDQQGAQIYLEAVTVLRVDSPEILAELRSSKAARFLGDLLGPTTVIVRPGAQEKVLAALAEMGYLAELTLSD
ncbi:MAG TPA: helicase-associated domain-containing protein [Anaerolineaceae bacterium]|nr:helicase-associated domain-containing protein [Anaerolineaceae bacterium]